MRSQARTKVIGRILRILALLLMILAGVGIAMRLAAVAHGTGGVFAELGIAEPVCVVAHVFPRSSALGAVLWSGC